MPRVAFPARCAVAVICGENLISQVYPASVPVEVFLDDAVELLSDDLKRRGGQGLDHGLAYELHRTNGTRLDTTKTLDDLGVEDGTTLVLVPADEGEPFEPQYESLSTGLARVGKRLFTPVTPESARHTALGILWMVVLTVLALSVYTRLNSDSPAPGAVSLTMGMFAMGGALAVRRWFPDHHDLLDGLAWPAVPLLSGGLAMLAPGSVGAAHLFIAALAAAVSACSVAALTGRHSSAAAAVVTVSCSVGVLAAIRMWAPMPGQRLGLCALVGLLILITAAPTLALWAARIRPPHFGSITGRDLFRRADGMPADAVMPVDEDADDEPNADTTPTGQAVTEAAKRANGVLTGILVAAAIALPAAAWATLAPGTEHGAAAAILVALFVVIYISRARAFTDRRHAIALVYGATGAVCAAAARYGQAAEGKSTAVLLAVVLLLAVFATAGLAAALLVPVTRFTPLVRMVTEWLELAAVVAALPIAAWIGGLFNWVRMR